MPPSPLIVVVEDEALLRMEAVDLLEAAGFETLEAANADEAMIFMRQRWPDVQVLFTDVQMPGHMDGVDLVEEVHRCWPNVRLLVTSAGVALKNEELPDDGRFIAKPYRASTLLEQVRDVIAKGR